MINSNTPVNIAHAMWQQYQQAAKNAFRTPKVGFNIQKLLTEYQSMIGKERHTPLNITYKPLTTIIECEYLKATPQNLIAQLLDAIGYVSKSGNKLSGSLIQKFERELGYRRDNEYDKFLYNVNHIETNKLKKAPGGNLYHYVEKINLQAIYDPEKPRRGNNIKTKCPSLSALDWGAIDKSGKQAVQLGIKGIEHDTYKLIIQGIIDKLWGKMQIAKSIP